jgi:hypothetical protein
MPGSIVSETEQTRREVEGEHPEVDRAYEEGEGGQVPEKQDPPEAYEGPDPEADRSGDADDEDQGT